MDLRLTGRHILITGGSKGIGLACAQEFGREGARVTLTAREPATLAQAVESLRSAGVDAAAAPADLRDAQAAQDMVEGVWRDRGPVDVLVNSAGAAQRTPFDLLTAQSWHDAMQAKFFTYIHVMTPLIPRMAQAGSGVVINVVGGGGKVASPTHLAGGSANAALMLASAGLANAWGPRGVRVNAVNPGLTMTERLHQGLAADAQLQKSTPEAVLAVHEQRLPLRRIAQPAEIADAVVYLASPRASYINGAVIGMDGGVVPMVV